MNASISSQQDIEAVIPLQVNDVQHIKIDKNPRLLLGESSFELNASGNLIWSLCKGNFNLDEIVALIDEAFPDTKVDTASQVYSLVEKLADNKLLQLKSQSDFYSESPWGDDSTYVHYHKPSPEMLWHLETVRQFVSGLYEPFELKKVESRSIKSAENELLRTSLDLAKLQDANTAKSVGQGELEQYRHFSRSETFTSHIDVVQSEIVLLIPDIEKNIRPSGHAYYHNKGFMGWHSNRKMPGRRVYCTWSEKEKTNFFRYEDPLTGDLVTHWEPAGWTIKSFQIPPLPYRLWHCIQADSRRFALGFRATSG